MRFLLDVCAASRTFQKALADDGHDVLSALDGHAQAVDEELLALAFREDRVLITKDKDFGRLVVVQRLPHPCTIRFAGLRLTEQITAIHDLIKNESAPIRDRALIMVTRDRVRIRAAY